VFSKLWPRVKAHGLEAAFWIDMGIVDMVTDMMANGMPTKPERFLALASEFGLHAEEAESEIAKLVGHYVNPASSKQVAELLFKTLRLRSRKKNKKTGDDSTDQKYLEQMRGDHPVVGKILEWRKAKKLQTTYAEALPRLVDSAGRIHPRIKTTRTSTGRLATAVPNLQNIPVRSKEGRAIRDCFIASPGCTFLSLDYSQIELRTLAHESRDPVMMEAYWNDEDIHSKTASLVFGIPVADLHPYNHRRPAKTCNFAVVYGITPEGLQDSLAREGADQSLWNLEKCTEFIAEWFKIYKGVRAYMQHQEEHARQHGYVKDLFGRIRRIPGVYSTIKSVVSGAIREAGNMPIQAGAQEIMKMAMADLTPVYRKWAAEGRVVRPIMQIHDDLLWEVEEGMVAEVYHVCKIMMENAVQLRVPVKADGKVGPVWGMMKEVSAHDL
jgi:DNA polymerase-1